MKILPIWLHKSFFHFRFKLIYIKNGFLILKDDFGSLLVNNRYMPVIAYQQINVPDINLCDFLDK